MIQRGRLEMATKHAVIVTGANRGIGLQLCRFLAGRKDPENCAVYPEIGEVCPWFDVIVMVGRDLGKVEAAVDEVKSSAAENVEIVAMQADVNDEWSIQEFATQISEKFGKESNVRIKALVNNAGVLNDEWTAQVLEDAMKTNVKGAIHMVKVLAPLMEDGGRIVNVTSGFGMSKMLAPDIWEAIDSKTSMDDVLKGLPFEADALQRFPKPTGKRLTVMVPSYKITKALLNKATQVFSRDPTLTSRRLVINAACPGWCDTDMGRQAGSQPPRGAEQGAYSILWLLRHPEPSPTGRFFRDGTELSW